MWEEVSQVGHGMQKPRGPQLCVEEAALDDVVEDLEPCGGDRGEHARDRAVLDGHVRAVDRRFHMACVDRAAGAVHRLGRVDDERAEVSVR